AQANAATVEQTTLRIVIAPEEEGLRCARAAYRAGRESPRDKRNKQGPGSGLPRRGEVLLVRSYQRAWAPSRVSTRVSSAMAEASTVSVWSQGEARMPQRDARSSRIMWRSASSTASWRTKRSDA